MCHAFRQRVPIERGKLVGELKWSHLGNTNIYIYIIYITLTWFIGWLGRKRSFEDLQSRKCAGSSYSSSVRDSKHFKVHALRIF